MSDQRSPRPALLYLSVLLALAIGTRALGQPGPLQTSAPQDTPAPPPHPFLLLELHRVADGPLYPWEPLWLMLVVTNTSPDQSTVYLPPGDGSYSALREPTVRRTVSALQQDGTWRSTGMNGFHCRSIDGEWRDEVIVLPPGRSHICLATIYPAFLQNAASTRIRIEFEYVYNATAPKSLSGEPLPGDEPLGAMAGVPPFTLTSSPVEFEIEAPLRLEVRQRKQLPLSEDIDLADYFDVALINVSENPVAVGANPTADLRVHLMGLPAKLATPSPAMEQSMTSVLGPGERLMLLGAGPGTATLPKHRIERPAHLRDVPLRLLATYVRPGWHSAVQSAETQVDIPPPPPLPPAPPSRPSPVA